MSSKPIITVNEGKVRGIKKKSYYSNVEYYSFLGVPYGQSTAGRARFKDPVKVKPWHNILDATEEKYGCIQFSFRKYVINGDEDCLYNNIHIPEIPKKSTPLRAVIVNIHAGAMVSGSPDPHYYGSPEFLMHHGFIYVCIGFRLHIFANLNLGLEDCSGNQALKDVILGLTWIKQNIKAFGGDPDNITLLGSSSGSTIVHCLLLSSQANGLYHKAVMMGLYMFNPLIVIPTDHYLLAYKMAVNLGYDGDMQDKKKLLQFFKKVPADTMVGLKIEKLINVENVPVFPTSPFTATVDPVGQRTLPLPFRELIPSMNRVPVIIGFCEKEAIFALLRSARVYLNKYLHQVLRQNKHGWGKDLTDEELKSIRKQIESYYLNDTSIEIAKLTTICDIMSDMSLSDVYDTFIDVISKDLPSSVYVYKFQYDGNLCTMKAKCKTLIEEPIEGTFHAADYSYWTHNEDFLGKTPGTIGAKDREIIEKLGNLVTSFAKTGDPNYEGIEVKWEPSTLDNPRYLSINETLQMKNEHLIGDRMKFWQNIKKQFQR